MLISSIKYRLDLVYSGLLDYSFSSLVTRMTCGRGKNFETLIHIVFSLLWTFHIFNNIFQLTTNITDYKRQ